MRWGASHSKDVSQSTPVEACCSGGPTIAGSWFGLGAIGTALATVTCCLGPLLFSVLGLSTFASLWILRHVVPYRNLFLAVTLGFLGIGFSTVYRRGRPARRRDQAILWASTLLVVALLGYSLSVEGLGVF